MWSRASSEPCRQARRVHALRLLAVLALVHAAGCRTPPLTEPAAQPPAGPGAVAARNAPPLPAHRSALPPQPPRRPRVHRREPQAQRRLPPVPRFPRRRARISSAR